MVSDFWICLPLCTVQYLLFHISLYQTIKEQCDRMPEGKSIQEHEIEHRLCEYFIQTISCKC